MLVKIFLSHFGHGKLSVGNKAVKLNAFVKASTGTEKVNVIINNVVISRYLQG